MPVAVKLSTFHSALPHLAQELVDAGADVWSRDPRIYDEYRYMLDLWKPVDFEVLHELLQGKARARGTWTT